MNLFLQRMESKLSDIQYIILVAVISCALSITWQLSIDFLFKPNINLGSPFNKYFIIVTLFGCIVEPIIESGIIVFIIWILRNFFHVHKKISLFLVTTGIFTLLHYYNILYIIYVFPSCLVIVYSYFFYKPKKFSSFKIMTLVHMLINTIIFCFF